MKADTGKKLKLDYVDSLSEVPASDTLGYLWIDDAFVLLLSGDLPNLPSLKAICMPNSYLYDADDLPELPELACIWVFGILDSKGRPIEDGWLFKRFPKLKLLVLDDGTETAYFADWVVEQLSLQKHVYFPDYSDDPNISARKRLLQIEKYDQIPEFAADARVEPWGERIRYGYCHLSDRKYISLGYELEHQQQAPRLLYTEKSLYLALTVWEALYYDPNPIETRRWAGFKLKFNLEDFWEMDGSFVKDGVLQVDDSTWEREEDFRSGKSIVPIYLF